MKMSPVWLGYLLMVMGIGNIIYARLCLLDLKDAKVHNTQIAIGVACMVYSIAIYFLAWLHHIDNGA